MACRRELAGFTALKNLWKPPFPTGSLSRPHWPIEPALPLDETGCSSTASPIRVTCLWTDDRDRSRSIRRPAKLEAHPGLRRHGVTAAGRCSPESPPSRASCSRRWAASPANLPCRKARAAPTPEFTRSARWRAFPSRPAFRLRICASPSTAPCRLRFASLKRRPSQPHSMRAIRPSPRPTNTGSFAEASARLFWPAMSTPVPGRWTSKPCRGRPRLFVGEHDFLSFAATDPDLATRNPDLDQDAPPPSRAWRKSAKHLLLRLGGAPRAKPASLLIYRVRGSGFLHHMVRNLVGTMLDVGRGYRQLAEIPAIIAARSRSAAGPTAPPQGLFLHSVEYPSDI